MPKPDKREVKVLTEELKKEYPYGVKSYRTWDLFKTEAKYRKFLRAWVNGCEGSEQERAYTALFALDGGKPYCDTDLC